MEVNFRNQDLICDSALRAEYDKDPLRFVENRQKAFVFSGTLNILVADSRITRIFNLYEDCLTVLSDESDSRLLVTSIGWKTVHPFSQLCQSGKTMYGFVMEGAGTSETFYTDSQEDLDVWIDHLWPRVINLNIDQDFNITSSIGEGSFSNVYRATSLIDGKQYCVKSIYKERITCKQLHSLLIQEIEIGRNVKHENICRVVSVYEERRMVHLVMECIDGDNLLDLLLDSGVLEESKTARIAGQVLVALTHLHDHGIIHRDLKPENLLLTKTGTVKLIDFGLSASPTNPCTKGTIVGSPCYIAPEILRNEEYGPAVDLFSLGTICYTLLFNQLPFKGSSTEERLAKNMDCQFTFPDYMEASEDAKDFICALLTPSADTRMNLEDALSHPWIEGTKNKGAGSGGSTQVAEAIPEIIVRQPDKDLNFGFGMMADFQMARLGANEGKHKALQEVLRTS